MTALFLDMVSSHNNSCIDKSIPEPVGIALIGVNAVTSLYGVIGNSLVCMTVFSTTSMFSSFHHFVASLAIADITIAVVVQPSLILLLVERMKSKCFTHSFTKTDLAFTITANFACAASGLMLALISVDRCLFIYQVCGYENVMTKGKKIVLGIIWIQAGIYCCLRVLIDEKITSILFVVGAFTSCLTIAVSYVLIFVKIRHHRSDLRDGSACEDDTDTELKFALTIILVVFVFTAAWFYQFYLHLTQPKKNYGAAYDTSSTVGLSSSAFNPILYCFLNQEYRNGLKRVCMNCGLTCRERDEYEEI